MPKDIIGTNLIPTPNPSEFGLEVTAKNSVLWSIASMPQAIGVAYKNFPEGFIEMSMLENYGDYIFNKSIPAEDGYVRLIFLKPKTQAEADIPFKVTSRFGNHHWYPILKALEIIPDYNAPRSYRSANGNGQILISGPSFYVREEYIPHASEGSRFVKEEFFSSTPFDIPQYPVPQPSSVSYDVPGRSGSFPECLHDDIPIADLTTASAIQIVGAGGGSGSSNQIGSGIQGQFFPATNFQGWTPYVIEDSQDDSLGYYRVRITVYPPPMPELIIQ